MMLHRVQCSRVVEAFAEVQIFFCEDKGVRLQTCEEAGAEKRRSQHLREYIIAKLGADLLLTMGSSGERRRP